MYCECMAYYKLINHYQVKSVHMINHYDKSLSAKECTHDKLLDFSGLCDEDDEPLYSERVRKMLRHTKALH